MSTKHRYVITFDTANGTVALSEIQPPVRNADGRFRDMGKGRSKQAQCRYAAVCTLFRKP